MKQSNNNQNDCLIAKVIVIKNNDMANTLLITKAQQNKLRGKRAVRGFLTDVQRKTGVSIQTMTRLIEVGKADATTIQKIEQYLGEPLELKTA